MKDILGLVVVVIGSSIFGRGFKMLSPELQKKFAKEMHNKMSAFLTKRAPDGVTWTCQECGWSHWVDSVACSNCGEPRR